MSSPQQVDRQQVDHRRRQHQVEEAQPEEQQAPRQTNQLQEVKQIGSADRDGATTTGEEVKAAGDQAGENDVQLQISKMHGSSLLERYSGH